MIAALSVRRFRNLADFDQDWSAPSNALVAGTGAGKTSVLEAIYLVATTRSFRTDQLADCCALRPFGAETPLPGEPASPETSAEGFFVGAETGPGERYRFALSWQPAAGLVRTRNGSPSRLADHLAVLPVLSWRTEDAEILVGPPALRRRFIDRLLLTRTPADLEPYRRFRQALEAKRRVLRSAQGGLHAWNELFARASIALSLRRIELVRSLDRALAEAPQRAGLPLPPLSIAITPSPPYAELGSEAAERLRDELDRDAGTERARAQALVGAHRDRLEVRMGGRRLRAVASAGERKAAGLLALWAMRQCLPPHAPPPLLLLDDADAELDLPTFRRLYTLLLGGGQLFLASNRPEVLNGLPVDAVWGLAEGRPARR